MSGFCLFEKMIIFYILRTALNCFTVTSITFTPRANESDNGEARDGTYQRCEGGSVIQAVGKEGKEELPFHPVNLLCVPDVAFDPVGD